MALTRRAFLISAPIAAGLLVACARRQAGRVQTPYSELRSTSAPSPDAKTILVLMPETQQTNDVWTGLSDELTRDFRVVAVRIDHPKDVSLIEQAMDRHSPAGLVLVNNPTTAAYRDFQQLHPGARFPPAVIVMTSFLDDPASQLKNATGISYEIPLMMLISDLRRVLVLRTERVGVIVRSPLLQFISRQIELARREQVVVEVEQVASSPRPAELKGAIRRLKQHVDVLWILNDDQLLTPRLITKAWLPGLDERPWVPTIVGAAPLVSPQNSLGTFAVLPDHVALGTQAANLVMRIAESDWNVTSGSRIQLPRSTMISIDLPQVRDRFTLQPHGLEQVDKILE